jgi:tocopherol O-methyltransferase
MQQLTYRIRQHYNVLAPFYYGLWGRHVHHGYWDDSSDTAPPAAAQERLVAELATFAGHSAPQQVLDVGCGFGGSLLWFATHAQAQGIGMTLSPVQCLVGRLAVQRQQLQERVQIHVADAQQPWPLPDASVDMVWCVECSEHLADRGHFAREAWRVLKPGGVLALAAWLAGDEQTPEAAALRQAVEQSMLCYPFDTAAAYIEHLSAAGFADMQHRTITTHVLRTWDICIELRERPGLPLLSTLLRGDIQRFARSFDWLRAAYQQGAMEYGLFRARKPEPGQTLSAA